MDQVTRLVDFVMLGWGKIGWPSEVSGFLMRFLKIKHIALKHCFGLNTFREIFYGKPYHIWYCIWGNVWFVSMEKIGIFYKTLGKEFYGFIALFTNSKDVLSWLVIFGKLIENVIDKKWFWKIWEPCEYIGYFKDFCETTWNWTVFWFHVNFELFMFYPWAMTFDYPVITQSDVVIFVTLVSWHLVFVANWCLRGLIDVFVA